MSLLANRAYRHLFSAQVVALVGTGLATVALGLLAYRLAGPAAGQVLGTAFAIKMVAYVVVAPVVTALADGLPRRAFLVSMDLVRAGAAVMLPWVSEVWHVYVLIVLLQVASASFSPTFQATIPAVVPDQNDYTRALSLSRLAYELESLLSPVLAAGLLLLVTPGELFLGTAVGFVASAVLIVGVVLPRAERGERGGGFYSRATSGIRDYVATPRLRAVAGLNMAVAAAGAMVLVNTVVVVRGQLDRSDVAVAVALGAYGGGSMLVALVLPRVLDRVAERTVMLAGGAVAAAGLAVATAVFTVAPPGWLWPLLLVIWVVLGAGCSAALTPVGRLIRRSGGSGAWPALFAAQFALSHAGWLVTYLLAGPVGASLGTPMTLLVLTVVAAAGVVAARHVWPVHDAEVPERLHQPS